MFIDCSELKNFATIELCTLEIPHNLINFDNFNVNELLIIENFKNSIFLSFFFEPSLKLTFFVFFTKFKFIKWRKHIKQRTIHHRWFTSTPRETMTVRWLDWCGGLDGIRGSEAQRDFKIASEISFILRVCRTCCSLTDYFSACSSVGGKFHLVWWTDSFDLCPSENFLFKIILVFS